MYTRIQEMPGWSTCPQEEHPGAANRRSEKRSDRRDSARRIAMFAALLIASTLIPARAELVANGGFEEGQGPPTAPGEKVVLAPGSTALERWEIFNGNVAWLAGSPPIHPTSGRFVNLANNGPYGGVRQTIATIPGSEYRLSFSLGGYMFRPGRVTVSIGTLQGVFWSPVGFDVFAWGRRDLAFVATAAATTISIVGTYGPYILLDDVSVTGPTPDQSGLEALTLSTAEVAGCRNVLATVTLTAPAPPGGVTVSVADTLAAATPPARVKIAEGATGKSFAIKTAPVASNQSGTVTVSLGDSSASQPLTIRPMGLGSLKLIPSTVVGGHEVMGTATLECFAGPGPVTIDLSASNAAVASPVAPMVVVPQGLRSQTFTVVTNPVLEKSVLMITGEAGTTTKSRRLNVLPAAVISPILMQWDTVAVGQTSDEMVASLRNDGVVPFTVNSISLAGTYASWFAQTNNCPASLAPGASCSISVRFTPQAALGKLAWLSIATSARSTPLHVRLSGAGI
jgi:hypothetical protein